MSKKDSNDKSIEELLFEDSSIESLLMENDSLEKELIIGSDDIITDNKKKKKKDDNKDNKDNKDNLKKKSFFKTKKKNAKDKKVITGEVSEESLLGDLLVDSNESRGHSSNEDKKVKKTKKVKGKKENIKKKNKSSKKRPFWKKLVTLFIVLVFIGILMVAGFLGYIVLTAPEFNPEALSYQEQTVIYDKSGNIITTLGNEKREIVSYNELPQVLIDAIVATEDSRFFQHNGVDLARFLKASVGQVLGNSSAGGASTLTMQVVKNNLTTLDKTIKRKFQDMYLASFVLERQYTKEQIFEFYVNDSLLGSNVYGVQEASNYYFGKPVSELSLPEAALIAGLFQAPNGHNPYYNPESATKRMQTVLNLMVRHEYITEEEANLAKAIDVSSLLVGLEEKTPYQGYINTVVSEVISKTKNDPYTVPMKIYTALDTSIQDGINSVMNGTNYAWKDEVVQAGIAVVNCNTGEIVAIGAGRNRDGAKQYNYATMISRHPGSTAKPLFDYGPGLEYNNYSTYTLFNDEPWGYTNGPEIGNWDGRYEGVITLRRSLAVSRNIPALKAFQEISKSNIIEFVQSLGISPEISGNSIHEAHAIGGFNGSNPLEMAAAYAAFANGGYYNEPHSVTKIEYRTTGQVVEFKSTRTQVMADSTAYMMNNVLQYAVEHGFNGGARVYGGVVAAKTGTSNYDSATIKDYNLPSSAVNDLWTVAYTPDYSIGLWYGYDEISSEYYNSSGTYKDNLMKAVMKYIPVNKTGWSMPSSVVKSEVEVGTWPAQLPSENTPSDLIITEYFKKGTQPTEVSQRFAKLGDITNLNVTSNNGKVILSWEGAEPEVNTVEYLNKYYSQSVFGNSTSSLVQSRLNYNSSVLGNFGYGIYIKNEDGSLESVGFTTSNTYSFIPSRNSGKITVVVKAEYQSFSANSSDGVSKTISWINIEEEKDKDKEENNGNSTTVGSLTLDIGDTTMFASAGQYIDPGIKVFYNGEDVTKDATITYSVRETDISTTSLEEFVNKINKLGNRATPYELSYVVNYKGLTATKNRKLTIYGSLIG